MFAMDEFSEMLSMVTLVLSRGTSGVEGSIPCVLTGSSTDDSAVTDGNVSGISEGVETEAFISSEEASEEMYADDLSAELNADSDPC